MGLVFTRSTAAAPHVAVVARVPPDSMFAAHKEALEGQEVVAVGGQLSRVPRHAAELVARAAGKVRLTMRQGEEEWGVGRGGGTFPAVACTPSAGRVASTPDRAGRPGTRRTAERGSGARRASGGGGAGGWGLSRRFDRPRCGGMADEQGDRCAAGGRAAERSRGRRPGPRGPRRRLPLRRPRP